MFSRSRSLEKTHKLETLSRNLVATERMWDVMSATTVSDQTEGGRPSFLMRLELTGYGPLREYSTGGNQPGTNLVVPVEGKDMVAFQSLLGKRILLTTPAPRSLVQNEESEAEVLQLREELQKLRERYEALHSNFLSLVEESRRLS